MRQWAHCTLFMQNKHVKIMYYKKKCAASKQQRNVNSMSRYIEGIQFSSSTFTVKSTKKNKMIREFYQAIRESNEQKKKSSNN